MKDLVCHAISEILIYVMDHYFYYLGNFAEKYDGYKMDFKYTMDFGLVCEDVQRFCESRMVDICVIIQISGGISSSAAEWIEKIGLENG